MSNIEKKLGFIFRGIIVFLLFYYSSVLQLIPLKLFHIDVSQVDETLGVILLAFSSVILCVTFFLIYRVDLIREFKIFRKKIWENLDTGFRWWMIGLAIMVISNLIITYVFRAGGAGNEKAVQSMIGSLPWLMLIVAGIMAPFNEEIVFRKTLKDIFTSRWLFALFSFLLFGGAHVIGSSTNLIDYLYIIPYGALGGAFALAYYETDTVFTSMTFHMIHNIALILLSIFI